MSRRKSCDWHERAKRAEGCRRGQRRPDRGPRESAEHFSGERRRSGRREPRRKRRGEGSGACGDEVEEARAAQSCIVNRRKSCAWRGRREPKRGAAGACPRPTERIAGKGRGRTEADRLGPSGKRAARQGCRALRRTRERRVRDAAPYGGRESGASGMPRPTEDERAARQGCRRPTGDERAAHQGCRALRRTRKRCAGDAAPYGGRESGAPGMPHPYGGRESGASGIRRPTGDERAAHQGCRRPTGDERAAHQGCRALRGTREQRAGG